MVKLSKNKIHKLAERQYRLHRNSTIFDISKTKVESSTKLKIAMELFGVSSQEELMEILKRDDNNA